MTAHAVSTDLSIREPGEAESRLCRMLLPRACSDPIGRHYRLIFKGTAPKLAGGLSYRDDATALGGLTIHVIPPFRRAGVGSELLEYAADQAKLLGRSRMVADVDLLEEPAAEPFLCARGFQKAGTITSAEIGVDDWLVHMQRYEARLRAGAMKAPACSLFVALGDVSIREITRLHAEYVAHMRAVAGMAEPLQLERATDSLAVVIEEQLAGFVLARIQEGVLHILSWVVAPQFRGQDLGRALLYELAGRARDRAALLRFQFTNDARITARMVSVPGCRVTKVNARFVRSV